jgi:methionyl aminopeptidase
VRDFCGHGIGQVFHDAPQVLHYGRAGTGVVLEPGMIFTIEPMLNAGGHHVKVLRDEWTTVTKDHSLSAQFEHTVAVTDIGVEIFTLSAAERTRLTPTYDAQVRASLNAMPDHRTA